MFENFSQAACIAFDAGGISARLLGHRNYEPLHLLAGLLHTETVDKALYSSYGINKGTVNNALTDLYEKFEPHWQLPLPASSTTTLLLSKVNANLAKDAVVSRGQLLLKLSELPADNLGLLLEPCLKKLAHEHADYLAHQKSEATYTMGVMKLSRSELFDYAVRLSRSEPLWRSMLVSILHSKGITIDDIEKMAQT